MNGKMKRLIPIQSLSLSRILWNLEATAQHGSAAHSFAVTTSGPRSLNPPYYEAWPCRWPVQKPDYPEQRSLHGCWICGSCVKAQCEYRSRAARSKDSVMVGVVFLAHSSETAIAVAECIKIQRVNQHQRPKQ